MLGVLANDTSNTVSQWGLLGQPASTVLKAIRQQGKQRQRVVLRESHIGAVRYGVRTVLYTEDSHGSLLHDFLTLQWLLGGYVPNSAPVPRSVFRSQRQRGALCVTRNAGCACASMTMARSLPGEPPL
jgi:hypothetical protein